MDGCGWFHDGGSACNQYGLYPVSYTHLDVYKRQAEKIREDLGGVKVIEVVLIEKAWQNDFQAYDNMIVGASTWFDGELPDVYKRQLKGLSQTGH